jgi:hypothetical protein
MKCQILEISYLISVDLKMYSAWQVYLVKKESDQGTWFIRSSPSRSLLKCFILSKPIKKKPQIYLLSGRDM